MILELHLSPITIVIGIILVSIFGYTVFSSLAEISTYFSGLTTTIAKLFGATTYLGAKTASVALKKTGELGEKGVDRVASASGVISSPSDNSSLSLRDKLLREDAEPAEKDDELSEELEKALDTREFEPSTSYVMQRSSENTQSRNNVKKAGYCYVGVDNGIRGCLKVYKDDTCMSGNVYPTMDICMNPNLRM